MGNKQNIFFWPVKVDSLSQSLIKCIRSWHANLILLVSINLWLTNGAIFFRYPKELGWGINLVWKHFEKYLGLKSLGCYIQSEKVSVSSNTDNWKTSHSYLLVQFAEMYENLS